MWLFNSFTCQFRMPQFQQTENYVASQHPAVNTSVICNLLNHSLVVLECRCSKNCSQHLYNMQLIYSCTCHFRMPTTYHTAVNTSVICDFNSFTCQFRIPQFQQAAVNIFITCNLFINSLVILECRCSNKLQSTPL